MDSQELNLKVAELSGWKLKEVPADESGPICWDVIKPDGKPIGLLYGVRAHAISKLPNFSGSLDAMAEAEEGIPDEAYEKYAQILEGIYLDRTRGFSARGAICATASERAEAFIRVMGIGANRWYGVGVADVMNQGSTVSKSTLENLNADLRKQITASQIAPEP